MWLFILAWIAIAVVGIILSITEPKKYAPPNV